MKFGLNNVNSGVLCDPLTAADLAVTAEELGFSSLWAGDHVVIPVEYASRYPVPGVSETPFHHDSVIADPITFLSYLAAVTESIRLGIGTLVLAMHNPLEVAKALATLDQLSRGRVTVAIGTGWLREEFDALGVSFDERLRRTVEGIEIMRALWAAPGASFSGDSFTFAPVTCNPRPVQPGGIPIVIGGYVPATARRAGRIGDGHYPGHASVEQIRSYRTEIQRGAMESLRDASSVPSIVAAPLDRPLTLDLCRQYEEAGVEEILIYVPESGTYPDAPPQEGWFSRCRESLLRFKSTIMDPLANDTP